MGLAGDGGTGNTRDAHGPCCAVKTEPSPVSLTWDHCGLAVSMKQQQAALLACLEVKSLRSFTVPNSFGHEDGVLTETWLSGRGRMRALRTGLGDRKRLAGISHALTQVIRVACAGVRVLQ